MIIVQGAGRLTAMHMAEQETAQGKSKSLTPMKHNKGENMFDPDKDYQKIADILRETCAGMNYDQFNNLVDQFAAMFSNDNPNFQAIEFYEACGL